jgi:hypothetical protein
MHKNTLAAAVIAASLASGTAAAECTREQATAKAQELSVAIQQKMQKDPRRAQEIRNKAQGIPQNPQPGEDVCAQYDALLTEARS